MNEIDPAILEIARGEASDCLERIERNLLALESGTGDPELIDEMFRDAHSVKGAAGMVGWVQVAAIAHAMEDRLEQAREQGSIPAKLIETLLKASDELRGAVDSAGGEPRMSPRTEEPLTPQARAPTQEHQRSLRVPAQKVDRMLDAVGETVLHHRRLEHIVGERIAVAGDDVAEEELDRGEQLLDELQNSVIEMRTLPLSSITAPLPRAVRDLAVTEGKEVALTISGSETQLDRVILEGIADPIVHLLRNAVAHGIERPDERERAGKSRQGSIELRAEQRGGMVALYVSDDGHGVSAPLLERASDTGSLVDVLATAGFSTAVEVDDLAGRGVGLDAVKSHVEALGGSIEVRSEPGHGMEVTLLLPITLALLNVLLCRRSGQTFGLPVSSIREIVTIEEVASLEGRPSLQHRGEAIPLGDLAEMVGAPVTVAPQPQPAMILASATRAVAVACDRVIGDRELVVKSLGPLLSGVEGYLGAGILGDGNVSLILDPNRLLEMPSPTSSSLVPPPRASVEPKKILVVDDQFTVREMQRSILEAAGYRVDTARNGREGLQRLLADPQVEMVLTDVQMPEMDGFELLKAIREDPVHASLPVAIVTSKGGEEDKRRGAEEGADTYIVKDEFNQQTLLEAIERLIGR